MKKLFLFFAIATVALTSCSSEDSSSNPAATLIKREIDHYSDGSSTTYNFTYNGSKMISIIDSDGSRSNYTYTGDLITNIKHYDGVDLDQEDIFTYNSSGQLVEFVMLGYVGEWGNKEVYVHNTDGSISVTEYTGNLVSQTNANGSGTITFLSTGEIGSITHDGQTYVYTYDNMNHDFKNVTGFGKISFVNSGAEGINHNITTEINGANTSIETYTYNAAGYPVTSSEDYNGDITTTEYFYE